MSCSHFTTTKKSGRGCSRDWPSILASTRKICKRPTARIGRPNDGVEPRRASHDTTDARGPGAPRTRPPGVGSNALLAA